MDMHTYTLNSNTHTCTRIHTHTHNYAHKYTHMYAHKHTRMHTNTHAYAHKHTHTKYYQELIIFGEVEYYQLLVLSIMNTHGINIFKTTSKSNPMNILRALIF